MRLPTTNRPASRGYRSTAVKGNHGEQAEALRAFLLRTFAEELHVEVEADTDLFGSGVLDSLVFVELVVRLEEELGFAIAVEEIELDDFRSVDRIVGTLTRG